MVKLTVVEASISSFRTKSHGFVGVFAGGTSGIGEATVKAFAAHSEHARFYIIGRNQENAAAIIAECQTLSPTCKFTFLQQDLALLKDVDKVSAKLIDLEASIDLLVMSMGYLSIKGRNETSEGLDTLLSLRYYARMRLTLNLLGPLSASPSGRVLSIFAPGKGEWALDLTDLGLLNPSNYGIFSGVSHASYMTTFFFEALSRRHRGLSFLHVYPGEVKTAEFARAEFPAVVRWFFYWVVLPLLAATGQLLGYGEVGARMVWNGVSARYPGRDVGGRERMVGLPEGVEVMEGSDGEKGSGSYCVTCTGERVNNAARLARYREQGGPTIIWEHTMKVFDEVGHGS